MDSIVGYLLENAPWLVAIGVVWYASWKVSKYHSKLEDTNSKVAQLPCETMSDTQKSVKNKVEQMDKIVSNLPCADRDKSFRSIEKKLDSIIVYLTTRNPQATFVFSKKASPRKLNGYGERVYIACKGEEFLSANKALLIGEIESKQPKTALDVEQSALEVLVKLLSDDIFNSLKNWVYNSPSFKLEINGETKDYSVTIEDLCFILSLPLRDMYLALHPEYNEKDA